MRCSHAIAFRHSLVTGNFRFVVCRVKPKSAHAPLCTLINIRSECIITGNFRFVVRSIFAHAQIRITTETLQPPWLTETQGDGWVSGTLGRDMAANPLQALIMHSLRSVHKGACADFGLTLQTTNLKFPVTKEWRNAIACELRMRNRHKCEPRPSQNRSPKLPLLLVCRQTG